MTTTTRPTNQQASSRPALAPNKGIVAGSVTPVLGVRILPAYCLGCDLALRCRDVKDLPGGCQYAPCCVRLCPFPDCVIGGTREQGRPALTEAAKEGARLRAEGMAWPQVVRLVHASETTIKKYIKRQKGAQTI